MCLHSLLVGVEVHGTNTYEFFEDDEDYSVKLYTETLPTLSQTMCRFGINGKGTFSSVVPYEKNFHWKAIAATDSGNITHIQEHIRFGQKIIADGQLTLFADSTGIHWPTGSSAIIIALLAKLNPYVAAAVSGTVDFSSMCTVGECYAAGNSIIENMTKREVSDKLVHRHTAPNPWPIVELSTLTIQTAPIFLKPNNQRLGSIAIESMVGGSCRDLWSFRSKVLVPEGEIPDVKVGSTRPVYMPAPEP